MKSIVTIALFLLVGIAAWLIMRGPDEGEDLGNNDNAASVIEANWNADENIDLGEFQDKG